MDETTLKIAAASLIHDIGKFLDVGLLDLSKDFVSRNQDLYQPVRQGRFTHSHALATAGFIERFANLLPPEFADLNWGGGDLLINLAAMHHKPETPAQWIVTMADRLSSGFDRYDADDDEAVSVSPQDYRKTRLVPIFEELDIPDTEGHRSLCQRKYCYPLTALSPATIFPGKQSELVPHTDSDARGEYETLCRSFEKELGRILHRHDHPEMWLEHFSSLLMYFCSSIPSARTGKIVSDVSLYDHLRTTSALAVALYLYHRDHRTLDESSIRNSGEQKFLFVAGDFFGIQDFIFKGFGDTRKLRSKLLRGRSFAVSLYCELAADAICREAGLPFTSVVMNAAGKFTILAPNTPAAVAAINMAEKKINDWLVKIAYGETLFGVATLEASPADLSQEKFRNLWDQLQIQVERKKYTRIDLNQHGGIVQGYLNEFDNTLKRSMCPLCGKRPSAAEAEGSPLLRELGSSCKICRDHVFLGANLVRKDRLAIFLGQLSGERSEERLFEPIFGRYHIMFCSDNPPDRMHSGQLIKCWDLSAGPSTSRGERATTKLINGYVPVYSEQDRSDERILEGEKSDERKLELIEQIEVGDAKTFEHIACKALNFDETQRKFSGVAALGILKADVDELGLLMSCGLPKRSFTISRLATLSRQLDFFFTMYVPDLLKTSDEFNNIYTVFTGGDDLFVIGPWNRILELVEKLKSDFDRYVCHNQHVHFSAGIGFRKPNVPIEQMSTDAEVSEKASKSAGRNRLTVFGQTVTYDEFDSLMEIRESLQEWILNKWLNNAMLYRLNHLVFMAEIEQRLLSRGGGFRLQDLNCAKWRAHLAYSVERNVGKQLQTSDREKAAQEVREKCAMWLAHFGGKMRIPLWATLYERR